MVKAGYKQTEVGVIPEDWGDVELHHIGSAQGGGAFKSSRFKSSGDYQIIKMSNVYLGDLRLHRSQSFVSDVNDSDLGYLLNRDDILITLTGTTGKRDYGYTHLITDECNLLLNQRVARFVTNDKTCASYTYYQLNSATVLDNFYESSKGGTGNQTNVGIKDLVLTKIPLPPTLAEQEAIAGALSDADGLIESLEQLIHKKRQIKQGAMQTLLSPWQEEPKDNAPSTKDTPQPKNLKAGWVEKTFDEVFSFFSTATNSRSDLGEHGDTYYIHYGDIHTKFHSHLDFKSTRPSKIKREKCPSTTILRNGDWVMADASEDYDGVGKSIEISGLEDGVVSVAGLHTFLLREKNDDFVSGFKGHLGNQKRLHEEFLRVATGMKVFGVSKTALKGLNLTIPPKAEQTRIATILSDMDTEISTLETKLSKAKQIKQGMMQELLTGRTRLI